MNVDVNVTLRLDLSPGLEAALGNLARAWGGGRAVPPLRPYEAPKRDSLSEFERALRAELSEFERAWRSARSAPIEAVQPDVAEPVDHVAPPAAAPVAAPVAAGSPTSPWTAERNEIVRFCVAAGASNSEILPKVNACAGPPISMVQLSSIVKYRKLRKAPVPDAGASLAATAAPKATPPQPHPARPGAFPQVTKTDHNGELPTDDATIRQWAAQRGLCNGGEAIDLERINAKRVDLGLPPYARSTLQHSGATMRPASAGASR